MPLGDTLSTAPASNENGSLGQDVGVGVCLCQVYVLRCWACRPPPRRRIRFCSEVARPSLGFRTEFTAFARAHARGGGQVKWALRKEMLDMVQLDLAHATSLGTSAGLGRRGEGVATSGRLVREIVRDRDAL